MPIFLTTTIPYVNAKPHLGFALELVQADCLARYYRQRGIPISLRIGTDENASKNLEAARRHNVAPQQWVDTLAPHFRQLAEALNIAFDDFIRTTEPRHRKTVETILSQLDPADLEKRPYRGLYCRGCEDFWHERDLLERCCPEHGAQVEEVEEENIFFKLSQYQEQLEVLIGTDAILIRPPERKNEILAFIRNGLQDISISRDAERAGHWGIPFPGVPGQIVYVWIDALINYLVPLESQPGHWTSETRKKHLLGKNVWKFHAIYWPALLLSCGLPLPNELVIHGFVTINGRKISKSSGSTIDPIDCIAQYGADTIRFYLLHEIPSLGDGDFSFERLHNTYTHYLVNGLGNLTQRLLKLAELSQLQGPVSIDTSALPEVENALEEAQFKVYLDVLWREIDLLNQEIEHERPWELVKQGDLATARERCSNWLRRLSRLAFSLQPALPETAARILRLFTNSKLTPSDPLFPRFARNATDP